MGKHQLRKVPLFGIFFKDMDIAVNRGNRMAAHRALLRAAEDLEKDRPVVMFPEGTVSQEAPTLRPFKNGPFKLAIETQVPLLPISFINNHKLFPYKGQKGHSGGPGLAHVVIHEPVATAGMTEENLIPLRKQVFNTINDTLHEYETSHVKSYNTQ
jgi:1-acyl-sn-glycerol-3-phosphate acyltransferase